MSLRETILAAAGRREPVTLEIPEWGETFKLLPLSGAQCEEIELLCQQARSTGSYLCLRGLRARIAVWAVADQDGRNVFTMADTDALTREYRAVLDRIFETVKVHNGLTQEDADDVRVAVEKN